MSMIRKVTEGETVSALCGHEVRDGKRPTNRENDQKSTERYRQNFTLTSSLVLGAVSLKYQGVISLRAPSSRVERIRLTRVCRNLFSLS